MFNIIWLLKDCVWDCKCMYVWDRHAWLDLLAPRHIPRVWCQLPGVRWAAGVRCSHCCSPDPYSEKHSLGDSFIAGHCKRVEIFSLSSSVYQWILAKTGMTSSPSPRGTMWRYIHSVVWSTYSKEHRKSHRNMYIIQAELRKGPANKGRGIPQNSMMIKKGIGAQEVTSSTLVTQGPVRKKNIYIFFKTYITLLIHKRCKLMCNPCIDVHT